MPLPLGPKLVGCGDPAKLVELSMVRMGEGCLRYAIVFGGLVPKTGSPSPATLALHLTPATSARAVAAAAAAAAARGDAPDARGSTPVAAVPAAAAVTAKEEAAPRRRRASKEGGRTSPIGGRTSPIEGEVPRGASDEDDSAARSWKTLSFAPGEAPAARCAHAAVAWGPHRMLVHGGEGETPLGGRPPL